MATKNLLLLLFLFVSIPLLQAQVSGYFIDPESDEPRFVQRLAWKGDEYSRRYEVLVEKEEEGTYRSFSREFTEASFIDLSLTPGTYRFRVIPHDFLNLPGEGSDWAVIEVRAALKPELNETPEEISYEDNGTVCVLIFTGKNIDPNAEISLRRSDGVRAFPNTVNVFNNGSRIRLAFEKNTLAAGTYELHIKNPGGLETGRGGIIIAGDRSPVTEPEPPVGNPAPVKQPQLFPFDGYLGAAWMPLFLIYGDESFFSDQNFSLVSAAARFGILPKKMNMLSVGVEMSWCVYNAGFNDQFIKDLYGAVELNLLMQKNLDNQKTAIRFRLGAGISFNLTGNYEEADPAGMAYTNMGASFLVSVYKSLYLETGLNYVNHFTKTPYGCLCPWIGLGLQI